MRSDALGILAAPCLGVPLRELPQLIRVKGHSFLPTGSSPNASDLSRPRVWKESAGRASGVSAKRPWPQLYRLVPSPHSSPTDIAIAVSPGIRPLGEDSDEPFVERIHGTRYYG